LTPVVTHQGHTLASGAIRELAINGHIQSREPMLRRARPTSVIAHDLFGLPVQHQDDVDPAEALPPKPWSCRSPTTRWAW
jgi:hypothetical protein